MDQAGVDKVDTVFPLAGVYLDFLTAMLGGGVANETHFAMCHSRSTYCTWPVYLLLHHS